MLGEGEERTGRGAAMLVRTSCTDPLDRVAMSFSTAWVGIAVAAAFACESIPQLFCSTYRHAAVRWARVQQHAQRAVQPKAARKRVWERLTSALGMTS